MDTVPTKEALQARANALIADARSLSERIEAHPMMVWCRSHNVTPRELVTRIESGMSAAEVDDNQQSLRALRSECVAQAGGAEAPSAAAPRRAPRRMI